MREEQRVGLPWADSQPCQVLEPQQRWTPHPYLPSAKDLSGHSQKQSPLPKMLAPLAIWPLEHGAIKPCSDHLEAYPGKDGVNL